MLNRNKHSIINFSVFLLLISYGFILVNNSLFYHSHVTTNGAVISHAHPFSKQSDNKPYKNHHHSKIELLLLSSNGFCTIDIQSELRAISIVYLEYFVTQNVELELSNEYSLDIGRAPPKS
ncbi:MAG: hypothetical protein QM503_05935 [Bacteroidota bacterium]